MRTIIHDLKKKIKMFDKNDKVLYALTCKNHCVGCFSCWVKHPKKCIFNDEYKEICEYLKNSDELIIISKCRYGCYSGEVKRVLERCISYVLPYFTIRNKEIHHESRYNNNLKLSVYFYGNIAEEDKEIAEKLVKANAINLNVNNYKINYFDNLKELKKCIH